MNAGDGTLVLARARFGKRQNVLHRSISDPGKQCSGMGSILRFCSMVGETAESTMPFGGAYRDWKAGLFLNALLPSPW